MPDSPPSFRQRAEFFGLWLAEKILGLLPFGALHPIADVLGALVWALDARGRRVSLANLEAAFPGRLTARRASSIVRRSYQSFARTMLVLFWAPKLSPAVFRKMDFGAWEEGRGEGGAAIYLCLHASNFELLSLAMGATHGPGMVVAQRLKNPLLAGLFSRLRAATGHEIIPQERAMIRMFRHLKKGGYSCMLVDLTLDPSEASVAIEEFGGLKTCVTLMHAALALRTGARIIPTECRVLPGGRYRLIHHPPLEYPRDAGAEEIAQLCWNALEPAVRSCPENWLWSYKHWRFKPLGEEIGRYPFYANFAKRFDKLLAKQAARSSGRP